jgi:hypothetical protein
VTTSPAKRLILLYFAILFMPSGRPHAF